MRMKGEGVGCCIWRGQGKPLEEAMFGLRSDDKKEPAM